MWKTKWKTKWKLVFLSLIAFVKCENQNEFGQLPHCVDEQDVGYVLVSTLDGKLTALHANGNSAWEVETGNGPLLTSSIHNVELTNNGEWVRIIPSLSGSLYKFNGKTIDAIPINADTLLKSSFVYSSDIIIAGGRDVRTYGIVAKTGEMIYECSSDGCRNITQTKEEFDDIIVIERSTTTVRAHEPRTGIERWNFSVGHHNLKIPGASCINLDSAITSLNLSAVLPQGILIAAHKHLTVELWRHVFEAPIVKIWKWDGRDLLSVDVFNQEHLNRHEHDLQLRMSPAIYLGMHNKQLYIYESSRMLDALSKTKLHKSGELVETRAWTRFAWKPISASMGTALQEDMDSTALSVLYSSNYMDGNGYYFYTEVDLQKTIFCQGDSNHTIKFFSLLGFDGFPVVKTALFTFGLVLFTTVYSWFRLTKAKMQDTPLTGEITTATEVAMNGTKTNTLTPIVYNEARQHQSHFLDHFNVISQLGKGGYGIVFEVQQKIDKVNYAVKIIPLPQRPEANERVLREVRALAQLDHPNIVRYSTSWDEDTLPNFSDFKQINPFIENSLFSSIFEEEEEFDVQEQKIAIENDADDSFIVFEDSQSNSNSTRIHIENSSLLPTNTTNTSENANSTASNTNNPLNTKTDHNKQSADKARRYLFIQMQLCDKLTLKHWLVENSARSKDEIYQIYNQILSAVAYIHQMKLIHRDLKPSNIFFNQNTTPAQIKVGDFGLVTPMQNCTNDCVPTTGANNGHTRDAGTELYMSPEQRLGCNYNFKVDIFSLGVILFELLVFFATDSERIDRLQKLRRGIFDEEFTHSNPQEYGLLKLMLSPKAHERPDVSEIMGKIKRGYSE